MEKSHVAQPFQIILLAFFLTVVDYLKSYEKFGACNFIFIGLIQNNEIQQLSTCIGNLQ